MKKQKISKLTLIMLGLILIFYNNIIAFLNNVVGFVDWQSRLVIFVAVILITYYYTPWIKTIMRG